jgi:hypothetical protein
LNYFLNVFSPRTYSAFSRSGRDFSEFRDLHLPTLRTMHAGDRLVCYLSIASRWVGILEVTGAAIANRAAAYYPSPGVNGAAIPVKPTIWLEPELALSIHRPEIWTKFSRTRNRRPKENGWAGAFAASLIAMSEEDGNLICSELAIWSRRKVRTPLSPNQARALSTVGVF